MVIGLEGYDGSAWLIGMIVAQANAAKPNFKYLLCLLILCPFIVVVT